MGDTTGIAWTDSTFVPWVGCTKVSPACANCYAEQAKPTKQHEVRWGPGQPRHRTGPDNWRKPARWNREAEAAGVRRKVFCLSLGDWLDPEVPVEWLVGLLRLIGKTPNLDWQLLTKRPELWFERMCAVRASPEYEADVIAWVCDWVTLGAAPANVWVGTTVEDQQRADERIPALMHIPARVRFLSCEPLLEAIDLFGARYEINGGKQGAIGPWGGVNWVICGGESGDKARPFNLGWARSLRDQCASAGVSFFMKQVGDNAYTVETDYEECGGAPVGRSVTERYLSKAHHGADPAEWPEELRIRQFPTV